MPLYYAIRGERALHGLWRVACVQREGNTRQFLWRVCGASTFEPRHGVAQFAPSGLFRPERLWPNLQVLVARGARGRRARARVAGVASSVATTRSEGWDSAPCGRTDWPTLTSASAYLRLLRRFLGYPSGTRKDPSKPGRRRLRRRRAILFRSRARRKLATILVVPSRPRGTTVKTTTTRHAGDQVTQRGAEDK